MRIVSHDSKVKCFPFIFTIAVCLCYQKGNTQAPVNSATLECFEKNSFPFNPGNKDFGFLKQAVADKRIMILAEADPGMAHPSG
jgi:hypothetical protein